MQRAAESLPRDLWGQAAKLIDAAGLDQIYSDFLGKAPVWRDKRTGVEISQKEFDDRIAVAKAGLAALKKRS